MPATSSLPVTKERRGGNVLPLLCYGGVLGASLLLLMAGVRGHWLAAVLFGLGLFHGGLDRENGRLVLPGWGYSATYLFVALAMVGVMIFNPLAGLVGFFALSVWHVARESGHRAGDRIAGAGEALALVGGSALLRPNETFLLVESIAGRGSEAIVVLLGGAGVGAVLLTLWSMVRRSPLAPALAISFVGYAFLPPLVAIGAAFLAFHALPRVVELIGEAGWRQGWRLGALGLVALAGATFLIVGMTQGWWSAALLAAVLIGLATPHMLLDRTLREEGTAEPNREGRAP